MTIQKPHICFISESRATYGLLAGDACTKVGGAEVQQTVLASALQKLGYTITFIVPDQGQAAKVVTEQGITLVKMRAQARSVRGLKYADEIARTFQALGRADADIYYQRIGGHITGIAALYCKLHRKPFVFSVAHNNDLDGSARKRLGPHYHALYRYGLRHSTTVVVQTDDQAELLKQNVRREGVLIRSTFALPAEAEVTAQKKSIVWVGNFKQLKRPELFIELASRLPQYPFVMVGGAGEAQESLMAELSAKAESIPNLRLTGAVPYREVGGYFGEARLFVNTSSDEGFPNTYLQAWSRGAPVIATFDADRLIARYSLGRYCSTLDELVSAVDEFMKDDRLWAATSDHVLSYVRENHGPEAIVAKYDDLLMNLCRKS